MNICKFECFSCPTVIPSDLEDDVMINSMTGLLTIEQIMESEVPDLGFFQLEASPMYTLHIILYYSH